jgi:hypothetical protein
MAVEGQGNQVVLRLERESYLLKDGSEAEGMWFCSYPLFGLGQRIVGARNSVVGGKLPAGGKRKERVHALQNLQEEFEVPCGILDRS